MNIYCINFYIRNVRGKYSFFALFFEFYLEFNMKVIGNS